MVNKWLTLDKIVFYIVSVSITLTAIACLTIVLTTAEITEITETTETTESPITVPPIIGDPIAKNG